MGFSVSQHGQLGAIPPPPFLSVSPLESMRRGGAIPPLKRGISAILARYPMKTRQMGAIPPSAILSRKGIARYGGVFRTGPLRASGGKRIEADKSKIVVRKVKHYQGHGMEVKVRDSKALMPGSIPSTDTPKNLHAKVSFWRAWDVARKVTRTSDMWRFHVIFLAFWLYDKKNNTFASFGEVKKICGQPKEHFWRTFWGANLKGRFCYKAGGRKTILNKDVGTRPV